MNFFANTWIAEWLAVLGFAAVAVQPVALDVPFALVSARR